MGALCRAGLLLLTVPVGPDVVVWNLHRRYGAQRLPHMLWGWSVEAVHGWDEGRLTAAVDWRRSYEPAFVLRAVAASPVPDAPHTEL